MILLSSLTIENYRNLQRVVLEDLKDFNVFIGPNNCGKTTILKAISLLQEEWFRVARDEPSLVCPECRRSHLTWSQNYPQHGVGGRRLENLPDDLNHRTENFRASYTFSQGFPIPSEVKPVIIVSPETGTQDMKHIYSHMSELFKQGQIQVVLTSQHERGPNHPVSHHVVPLNFTPRVLFITDLRLEQYKGINFMAHIANKRPPGAILNRLVRVISEVVDPNITDYIGSSGELIFQNGFQDVIKNQGSGVRSIICLVLDLLLAPAGSIILIDEPEIGLNPHAKQTLLKFLRTLNGHQIFMCTHDPAFLNPLLLKNLNHNIYIYSPISDHKNEQLEKPNFVKLNLTEPTETFSGYLPHTESLKPVHIYVEGSNDVRALQLYLIEGTNGSKLDTFNKLSIQHLGGSFWKHLLYTILNEPYTSLVILDTDKREEARETCAKYTEVKIASPKFCEDKNSIVSALNDKRTPVYCLKTGCVEDSLGNEDMENEIRALLDVVLGFQRRKGGT